MGATQTLTVRKSTNSNETHPRVQLLPVPRRGIVYVLYGMQMSFRNFGSGTDRITMTLVDRDFVERNSTLDNFDPQAIVLDFDENDQTPDVAGSLFDTTDQTEDQNHTIHTPLYELEWARQLWLVGAVEAHQWMFMLWWSTRRVSDREWAHLNRAGVSANHFGVE